MMLGKKKRKQRFNNRLRVVTWALIGILGIINILLSINIVKLGVIPSKYLIIICTSLYALFLILLFLSFFLRRKTPVLITISIITLLLITGFTFGLSKINEAVRFLYDNLGGIKTEIIEYSIIANANYQYEKLDDLKRKKFNMAENTEHKELIEDKVKLLVKGEINYRSSESDLLVEIKDNNKELIIIKKAFYDVTLENDERVKTYSKELYTFTIDKEIKEDKIDKDISKDPFILYIAGIDNRSGDMPMYCLTDVNMLVAVNPNTKDIAMVHIPRDYYVQLHGVTGIKDKLTHAGYQGGVKLSMSTIEDLMNVDIDYYIKLNFNALVKVVDAVGGVTIYNELKNGFTTRNDSSCYITPGINYLNGKCALAYARERFVYASGDVHRGQNQQQILEALINKVSSSKTIISNYSEILKSLEGSFNTNLTQEDISGLVKGQLENMSKWNISKYNITGFNGSGYTYSWPNSVSYVMLQNPEKIAEAKAKINEVLNKKVS